MYRYALVLLLSVTINTWANEVSPEQANETVRYIRDYLSIPLRSADSSTSKVVHAGLKSGTPLKVMQVNSTTNFSLVKTNDGKEGWISNQYLMDSIPTIVKLEHAEAKIQQLQNHASPEMLNSLNYESKYNELLVQLKTLEDQNHALSKEMEYIKSLSGNELKLNEQNKSLLTQFETTKRLNDTLLTENQSLQDQSKQNTFINGTIAVILGMLATLIIQSLNKSKKRDSGWAS